MTDEAAKILAEAIRDLAAAIRPTQSSAQYVGYIKDGKTPSGASGGGGRGADGVPYSGHVE